MDCQNPVMGARLVLHQAVPVSNPRDAEIQTVHTTLLPGLPGLGYMVTSHIYLWLLSRVEA